MNKTLNFLSYNNYYNRIIKRETSLAAYQQYSLYKLNDTNFNPNDGIHATHICNADFSEQTPDYLVVSLGNTIISRWFVLETTRQLEGQYNVILLRDVVADYYDKILDVPMAIQRCMVPDSSPYIYNDEGMTFNQVKKNTTLLKDASKSTWYVGYITKNLGTYEGAKFPIGDLAEPDYVYDTWNQFPWFTAVENIDEGATPYKGNARLDSLGMYYTYYNADSRPPLRQYYCNMVNGTVLDTTSPGISDLYGESELQLVDTTAIPTFNTQVATAVGSNQTAIFNGLKENRRLHEGNPLSTYNNKVVYIVSLDKYFRLVPVANFISTTERFTSRDTVPYRTMSNAIKTTDYYTSGKVVFDTGTNPFYVNYSYDEISFRAAEIIPSSSHYFNVPSSRNHLEDAPYDMFAIPANLSEIKTAPNASVPVLPEITKSAVNALIQNLQVAIGGTGFIYDVQLLPYCPIRNFDNSGFTVQGLTEGEDYQWIKTTNGNFREGIILFPKKSSFNFSITQTISVTNKKIQHLTEFHRLVSPNYAGVFEFSAAANNGVSQINVECTYKPFNPYIYLAPEFGGLYGDTFIYEQRGLICSGDFSLPIITDVWKQYELNNKNYDTIFNRSIQNLETNRGIASDREQIMLKYGALSGIAAGMGAGGGLGGGIGSAFGPIGSVAGMVVGGIAGGITGGIATQQAGLQDIAFNKRTYQEQVDYQTDVFHLQMGNIQALPNSLTRIGAQTINNPVWPMLEFYSATDEEKAELQEYINYRSMRAGFVGTIREYKQSSPKFFQGSPMRVTGIEEDAHILIQISNELMKGVYI